MRSFLAAVLIALGLPAAAQEVGDVFVDGPANAKAHTATGFVCPSTIGHFERNAVGERDPQAGADFCAYSGLDGIYGMITILPLTGPYDPKTALVPDFQEQEATGGRKIAEAPMQLAGRSVYTRLYEATRLADTRYRVLFAASAVGNWAIQVTMEYASPRDDAVQREFLDLVYAEALRKLAVRN